MLVINIVQAAVIDRMHSIIWVTVFPATVLGIAVALIVLNGVLSRDTLALTWRNTTGQTSRVRISNFVCIVITDTACSPSPSCLDWCHSFNSPADPCVPISVHALSRNPNMEESSMEHKDRSLASRALARC